MSIGDIVLYKNPTTIPYKAVTLLTHGPYFHVEILMLGRQTLGAYPDGIHYSTLPASFKDFTLFTLTPTPQYPNVYIDAGIGWAEKQLGKEYGWLDIACQAIKILAPNNPFQVTQADHWDCSDFVTRYIQHTGVILPDMFSDPYANTPNDIARWAGLLPPRKATA